MATETSTSMVEERQKEFDRIINSGTELYAIIRFFLGGNGNPIRIKNKKSFFIKVKVKSTIGDDLVHDVVVKILSNKHRFDAQRGTAMQWIKYKIIECVQLKFIKYCYITKVPNLKRRFLIQPEECPLHLLQEEWANNLDNIYSYEQFYLCSIDIEKAWNFIAYMDERDSDIIISNYIFDIPMKDLGIKYNVTRERIRQLRNRATLKVRQELNKEIENVTT